jgi:hypothetical protein
MRLRGLVLVLIPGIGGIGGIGGCLSVNVDS